MRTQKNYARLMLDVGMLISVMFAMVVMGMGVARSHNLVWNISSSDVLDADQYVGYGRAAKTMKATNYRTSTRTTRESTSLSGTQKNIEETQATQTMTETGVFEPTAEPTQKSESLNTSYGAATMSGIETNKSEELVAAATDEAVSVSPVGGAGSETPTTDNTHTSPEPRPVASYDTTTISQEPILTAKGNYIYPVNNGGCLDEVIQNLRGAEYESVCGFDYVGNKILDYTSYKKNTAYTTVPMREDFLNRGGLVLAHNHPSGNAFSGKDLYAEALYKTPCAMVISNEYIYTVMPGAQGWGNPEELRDYWQASYNYHLSYALSFTRNYQVDRQAVINSPDRPDNGTMAWVCDQAIKDAAANGKTSGSLKVPLGGWVSHMTMLDVAARFQLNYQRYLTDEFSEAALGLFWPSTTDAANGLVTWG